MLIETRGASSCAHHFWNIISWLITTCLRYMQLNLSYINICIEILKLRMYWWSCKGKYRNQYSISRAANAYTNIGIIRTLYFTAVVWTLERKYALLLRVLRQVAVKVRVLFREVNLCLSIPKNYNFSKRKLLRFISSLLRNNKGGNKTLLLSKYYIICDIYCEIS